MTLLALVPTTAARTKPMYQAKLLTHQNMMPSVTNGMR